MAVKRCYRYNMMDRYPGPVREQPLAIELHNTLYAVRGQLVDGLADESALAAWLAAVADRVPIEGREPEEGHLAEFLAVRAAVRSAVEAAVSKQGIPGAALAAINAASDRVPTSPRIVASDAREVRREIRFHSSQRAAIALGAIAVSTIDLLAGPRRSELRLCGAPGCVLAFVKSHPRREWCSTSCGNRARQARHYQRVRDQKQ